ncbi:MAG: hypothetical protein Q7V31_11955 [Parvibaculum sp.]|uniref:hypothetical protein n=1 Tax=Parvibaculum sp. TaxID=2024848 RepID=UPI00271C738B|nr:hypothetical protein [Parvibaculum sp.]MDO8839632.1 hypothetical protein [Parvibaculum sp.]
MTYHERRRHPAYDTARTRAYEARLAELAAIIAETHRDFEAGRRVLPTLTGKGARHAA